MKNTEIGKKLSSTINGAVEQSGKIKFEDGTPYITDLLKVAERLDNQTKSNVQLMVLATPSALDNIISTDHFEIHYTLDPASPDNTTIDFVNEVADDLENKTYQTEVTEWGYREGDSGILSSKYQVYIKYIECSPNCIIFGVTKPTPLLDGTTIEINNQISGYDEGLKLGTVAHEYHHASQYSYLTPLLSEKWVAEGSATWMEHEVFRKYYPNNVINYDFELFRNRMDEYLNTPYKDIADEREDNGYPSGQYWYFLADNSKINFNGTGMQRVVNRKVWEELDSHTWLDVNGAIDDALSSAPSGNNSFNESFKPFTRANYFKDSWYPNEINYMDDVYTIPIDLTAAPHEVTKTSGIDAGVYLVDHYGAEYFEVTAPDFANVNITFRANDPDTNFYIRVYPGGIENNETEIPLSDGKGNIITKATNIVVIVGRLNDGGLFGTPSGDFTINTTISNYSRKLTITGTTAGVQTNYQMKLTLYNSTGTDTPGNVYLGGNVRSDFGDIRFTKSDGVTLLDYWIESYTPGVSAVVWVEVDSIPASPNTANIYLYYGNPSATSVSNGDAAFIFFDNFAGTTINHSKWTVYNADGSISQNNKLIFGPKSAASLWTNTAVVSKQTFSRPIAIDAEWQITGGNFYPGEFSAIYFGKFQEPDRTGSNNIDWLRYDGDDRSYTQRWINGANQGQAKGAVLTAPISKKVSISTCKSSALLNNKNCVYA